MNTPPCPLTPRLVEDLDLLVNYNTINNYEFKQSKSDYLQNSDNYHSINILSSTLNTTPQRNKKSRIFENTDENPLRR